MNKKNGLAIINILITVILAVYLIFLKSEKVAYVDSNSLLSQYQGMIDARAEYNKLSSQWKAQIDTLAMEVQNELKRHERELPGMTSKEKGLSEQLIKSKQQQLLNYQRAIQDKAAEEDAKMTQAVIDEVNNYLKEFGNNRRYKIIFAATDVGNILYADEAIDITSEVVQGLNRRYKGE